MKFFAINEIPEDFQRWVKLFKKDMARFGLQKKYLLVCSIVDLKVLRVIIILNSVTEYIQMGTLMH